VTLTDFRPLAGVRFEDVPLVSPRILPRMDVVGFVGYARSGKMHDPVAVESVEDFRREFGGEVDLGWDEAGGRVVTGQLGAAVRDFFVNGGTRAWIVRVPGPLVGDPDEKGADVRSFVDMRLVGHGGGALVARAEELAWLGREPRPRGIHALLGVDEVTVVAVPDAAQVGWRRAPARQPGESPPSHDVPEEPPCDHGDFDECAPESRPGVPLLSPPQASDAGLVVEWAAPDPTGADGLGYVVEETRDPTGWQDAREVYRGGELRTVLTARSTVPRYFRVRAERVRAGASEAPVAGDWSQGRGAAGDPSLGLVATPVEDYEPRVLLGLHRALLRMCAARGDLLALLSVPEHYRADHVAGHWRTLTEPTAPVEADVVAPLQTWEMGYGALFHPWLVHGAPDVGTTVTTAGVPDGAVAGVIASRARTRGAWVAPANVRVHDVVATVSDESLPARQWLRDERVNANLVVRTRDSFRWLSEDTLTTDEDWRPISVRRLHSLLRRVVLLEGPHYVFEPNDAVLRRGIERGFVELMRFLFAQGAFAGATEREAFRVSVGAVNTAESVDAGRLIVEIAYAPSRPLEFLKVRLVHAGEPGFRLVGA